MREQDFKHQNRHFTYGLNSWLIRVLSYTYPNKPVLNETFYCVRAMFTLLERCPVHTPVCTPVYRLPLSQSDRRVRSLFQSVYNKLDYDGGFRTDRPAKKWWFCSHLLAERSIYNRKTLFAKRSRKGEEFKHFSGYNSYFL